jgi:hypothetical protein
MPPPAYRLILEDRTAYLYVRIEGEQGTYESTLAAVTEISILCKARKIAKLLVENTVPTQMSTLEIFKISIKLPGLYRGVRVGFVIQRPPAAKDPHFMESVARNRGAKGRLFANAADAERWLLSP